MLCIGHSLSWKLETTGYLIHKVQVSTGFPWYLIEYAGIPDTHEQPNPATSLSCCLAPHLATGHLAVSLSGNLAPCISHPAALCLTILPPCGLASTISPSTILCLTILLPCISHPAASCLAILLSCSLPSHYLAVSPSHRLAILLSYCLAPGHLNLTIPPPPPSCCRPAVLLSGCLSV